MTIIKWFISALLFVVMVQPGFAGDREKLVGTWRLISFEQEAQATRERTPILGKIPTGYWILTPEGRSIVIVTGEARKAPNTDNERAGLLQSMVAYTGMCRVEGDKLITKVDVSWNPGWVGTEQVRFFRFDGDRLHFITAWGPSVNRPEMGTGRSILTFERVK